jgi:peptidyl-prolyl cis-trans isomerase A (cyclophilin A)
MVRVYALALCVLILAQVSGLQCPGLNDGSAPDNPIIFPPRTIDAFAAASETDVQAGQTIELLGESVEPGDLAFSWVQTAGPGVVIENAHRPTASFVAPSVPTDTFFSFMVTVRNTAGDRGRSTVDVLVRGDPNYNYNTNGPRRPSNANSSGAGDIRPSANAGPDQRVTEGATVTLDGRQSSGRNLTFAWVQVNASNITLQNPTSPQPTFVAPEFNANVNGQNEYEFELTVKDDRNRSDTDRVVVRVRSASDRNPQVRIITTMGDITVELFPDDAPKTVENFLQYVEDDFYNGLIFHRVIAGFVVQGGGFQPGLTPRTPRAPIQLEAGLPNDRGTIAMARTDDPNSATSQFYFNLVDNDSLNPGAGRPGYAVFGRVVSGMSVVDRIATVPTEARSGHQDVPVDDVLILRTERID